MSNLPALLFYSDKIIFRLGRHIFLFASMILIFSWLVYMRDENEAGFLKISQGVFINALFFFTYAYITAYLLVPWLMSRKRYLLFSLAFIVTGLIISYLKFIVSDYVFYTAIATELSERLHYIDFSQILVNTKDMTFIVAVFLIAKFAKDNYHIKKRLRELQDHQIRSEIKLLKNQLDPHVVFNNLNNIYSMALNNSDAVGDNLGRFKSVLHYYFVEGKEQSVSLENELHTIKNYIDLEKLRYGDRLSVEYTVKGSPESKSVMPFLLFSYVENCFEHGCSIDSGKAWIKIIVELDQDSITFHASNSKPVNVLELKSGPNNKTIQEAKNKLELLYPGKYLLRIDDRNEMYCVDLKLRL